LGQTILQQHIEANQAQGLPIQGDAANHYLLRHHYAVRWAEANRQLIAQRFCDCLHVSGKQVLDIAHNTLLPLTNEQADHLGLIADNVDGYWIHRKGVSPTDQGLVMIPGSRGSLSYLVRPKIEAPEQLAQGGYSLAHGAGRKWKRTDAKGRLEGRYKVQDLTVTASGSRVICKAKDLLYEEAPQAYKNIDRVVNDLVAAGMIELVASFQPLITYKTRRR
jgi:release factor H-coupled RctB family protein